MILTFFEILKSRTSSGYGRRPLWLKTLLFEGFDEFMNSNHVLQQFEIRISGYARISVIQKKHTGILFTCTREPLSDHQERFFSYFTNLLYRSPLYWLCVGNICSTRISYEQFQPTSRPIEMLHFSSTLLSCAWCIWTSLLRTKAVLEVSKVCIFFQFQEQAILVRAQRRANRRVASADRTVARTSATTDTTRLDTEVVIEVKG